MTRDAGSGDADSPAFPGDAWQRRLLVALVDHLPRQRWVARVVAEKLSGSVERIATEGAFGHPEERPQQGPVPGEPAWSYYFHGIGCCLTHEDGTTIDVDFGEYGAEAIDPFFFDRYVASAARAEGVERLLRRPGSRGWMADLDALRELGWIEGNDTLCVTEAGKRTAESFGPALRELSGTPDSEQGVALASSIDDFSLAAELAGASADAHLLGRADAAASTRATRLGQQLAAPNAGHALDALGALGRKWAEPYVRAVLQDAPVRGALLSSALRLVESWDGADLESLLLALAQRAVGATLPAPYLRVAALRVVFRRYRSDTLPRDVRSIALAALEEDAHASEAGAGLLLYLLEPPQGVDRLRRALEHRVPLARSEAAAALTILATTDAAAALRECGGEEARVALALLRGFAPAPAPAPDGRLVDWNGQPRRVFSMEELVASHLPDLVASAVRSMHSQFGGLLDTWWAH